MSDAETTEILNVAQPGKTYRANWAKHDAMKNAVLKVLPTSTPGLTVEELGKSVLAYLPEKLFPGGAAAGRWIKAVQLDPEARNVIARVKARPLRPKEA